MSLSAAQCRAARALLGWSASDLASSAGVGIATVKRFELDQPVSDDTRAKLRTALEQAGVTLIEDGERSGPAGAGVRLATRS